MNERSRIDELLEQSSEDLIAYFQQFNVTAVPAPLGIEGRIAYTNSYFDVRRKKEVFPVPLLGQPSSRYGIHPCPLTIRRYQYGIVEEGFLLIDNGELQDITIYDVRRSQNRHSITVTPVNGSYVETKENTLLRRNYRPQRTPLRLVDLTRPQILETRPIYTLHQPEV